MSWQEADGQQPAPPPPDAPPPPTAPAPGWYPDPYGQVRWWDGANWGVAAAGTGTSDPKTMAVLSHALCLVVGFIAPLVIYLTSGKNDPFVRHHSAESLNFSITVFIGSLICIATMCIIIGFILLPVLIIGAYVFQIMGALAASRGEWWRYPINIRIVSGAVG
jgi:uncharacterized Tic20 family protein